MKSKFLSSKIDYGNHHHISKKDNILLTSFRTFECTAFAVQNDTDVAWKLNKAREINVKCAIKLRHPKSDFVFGNQQVGSVKMQVLNEAKVDGKMTFVIELTEL